MSDYIQTEWITRCNDALVKELTQLGIDAIVIIHVSEHTKWDHHFGDDHFESNFTESLGIEFKLSEDLKLYKLVGHWRESVFLRFKVK